MFRSSVFELCASSGQEIVGLLARANDTRIYHTEAYEAWELDAYCEDDNRGRDLQVSAFVFRALLGAFSRTDIQPPLPARSVRKEAMSVAMLAVHACFCSSRSRLHAVPYYLSI